MRGLRTLKVFQFVSNKKTRTNNNKKTRKNENRARRYVRNHNTIFYKAQQNYSA